MLQLHSKHAAAAAAAAAAPSLAYGEELLQRPNLNSWPHPVHSAAFPPNRCAYYCFL
jgi:hypothetical protein